MAKKTKAAVVDHSQRHRRTSIGASVNSRTVNKRKANKKKSRGQG